MSKNNTDISKLNSVTSTIVASLGNVGLFHYNKLTYLFEYFFIKNYGERYTKEQFIKYPKGPVIANYKDQICTLVKEDIFETDIKNLKEKRKLITDDYNSKVRVFSTDKTEDLVLNDPDAYSLLIKVIDKYSKYNVEDLGNLVYKTPPVLNYLLNQKRGYVKTTGGYVLNSNNIKINSLKREVPEHILMSRKHFLNYKNIDETQHAKDVEEFRFMEKLRPQYQE
jgi:hypothetical protein